MPGVIALKRSRSAEPQEDVFISMPEKRVATLRDLDSTQINKEKRFK